jgi:hypothetical protein
MDGGNDAHCQHNAVLWCLVAEVSQPKAPVAKVIMYHSHFFVNRMARQLEEKWRIILEEESNRSSNRCEGVNPWDFLLWSQYKS